MDTADFPPDGAMATLRGREPTESVLFIGTQFSNLYTAVDTPAKLWELPLWGAMEPA